MQPSISALRTYAAALDELKEVQKAAPNDPLVHLNMAFAYAGQKKYADAEREFQYTIKMYPTYDSAWADYVALLFGTNQSAKALALANQYATANPNRASAHFMNGSALATAKKYDAAMAEFQKVLQIDPKSMMAYVRIGSDSSRGRPNRRSSGLLPEGARTAAQLDYGEYRHWGCLYDQRRPEIGW